MCAPPKSIYAQNWYEYLDFPQVSPIVYNSTLGGFPNVTLLPGAAAIGQGAGFTELLSSPSDIWHTWYTSYPAQLVPLVQWDNNSQPVALGTPNFYANTLPVVSAGADQTVECASHAGTTVTLDGSGSDPDGDPLTFEWWYDGNVIATTPLASFTFPKGSHTVTLKAMDDQCGMSSDDVIITVEDTQAPVITGVGADQAVECPDNPYDYFSTPSVSDVCDPNPVLAYSDVVTPLCGNTYSVTRTWTATDDDNNMSTEDQTITLIDTQAPVITPATAVSMWPPNHEYMTFGISTMVNAVNDQCHTSLDVNDVTIHSVWSDEVEDGMGRRCHHG